MQFTCQHCQALLDVSDEMEGVVADCPCCTKSVKAIRIQQKTRQSELVELAQSADALPEATQLTNLLGANREKIAADREKISSTILAWKCEVCQIELTAVADLAGQEGTCPHCNQLTRAPSLPTKERQKSEKQQEVKERLTQNITKKESLSTSLPAVPTGEDTQQIRENEQATEREFLEEQALLNVEKLSQSNKEEKPQIRQLLQRSRTSRPVHKEPEEYSITVKPTPEQVAAKDASSKTKGWVIFLCTLFSIGLACFVVVYLENYKNASEKQGWQALGLTETVITEEEKNNLAIAAESAELLSYLAQTRNQVDEEQRPAEKVLRRILSSSSWKEREADMLFSEEVANSELPQKILSRTLPLRVRQFDSSWQLASGAKEEYYLLQEISPGFIPGWDATLPGGQFLVAMKQTEAGWKMLGDAFLQHYGRALEAFLDPELAQQGKHGTYTGILRRDRSEDEFGRPLFVVLGYASSSARQAVLPFSGSGVPALLETSQHEGEDDGGVFVVEQETWLAEFDLEWVAVDSEQDEVLLEEATVVEQDDLLSDPLLSDPKEALFFAVDLEEDDEIEENSETVQLEEVVQLDVEEELEETNAVQESAELELVITRIRLGPWSEPGVEAGKESEGIPIISSSNY